MRHLYGTFTGLDGRDFKVDIYCENGSGEAEITLGGTPFVTQMSSDGDSIYSPIKGSGATVEILTEGVEFEVYTVNPLGTKVTLTDISDEINPVILWTGYATPCAYTQPFDLATEYLQIECVDAISVLKSVKYFTIDDDTDGNPDGTTDRFPERTFIYLLNKCLGKSKSIKKLYINNAVQVGSPTKNEAIYEKIKISEQNFFEKRENITQTDINLSWTAYDVLFEICQYLGVTLYLDGENAYIIDYDAIRGNWNTYNVYNIDGVSDLRTTGTVNLEYRFNIKGGMEHENGTLAETGTRLSIGPVYNKVTVKDEFNVVSDDEDFETAITKRSVMTSSDCGGIIRGDFIDDINLAGENNGKTFNAFWITTSRGLAPDKKSNNEFSPFYIGTIHKFYRKSNWTFHKYSWNGSSLTDVTSQYENSCGFDDTQKVNGAFYCRMYHKCFAYNSSSWKDKLNNMPYPTSGTREQKLQWWADAFSLADANNVNMQPYIIMIRHFGWGIGPGNYFRTGNSNGDNIPDFKNEDCELYPYVTYKKKGALVFAGPESYVVIKGDILSHPIEEVPAFLTGENKSDKKWCNKHGDFKRGNQFFIWARLQLGEQYWTGDGWTTTPTNFKLWYKEVNGDKVKVRSYCDTFYSFCDNSVDTFVKTEGDGYYIPAPPNKNLNGDFIFTIFANRDMWGRTKYDAGHNHRWDRYYGNVYVIRNFEIKAVISNGLMDDWGRDSDTYYSNSLDTNAVDEFPEITFRITTFDDKNPNYSSPQYQNGDKSEDLKYITHKSLFYLESNHGSSSGTNEIVAEELLIFRIVNQYSKPRVEYEYNLKNAGHKLYGLYTDSIINNRQFIIDSVNIDYRQNKIEAKLVEKG